MPPPGGAPSPPNPAPDRRTPEAPVPALLAAAPDAVGLVKALRRCWVRSAFLGILAAAGAGVAAWFLVPPSKHTARTMLRVPAQVPFMFQTAERVPNQSDHQRTQVALAKSRLVLNAALKTPGVGDSATVQARPDPLEWLERDLQVDFSVAPEVMRITLSGDHPADLKAIVNAVRDAYCTKILDKERADRLERLQKLVALRQSHQDQLKNKRDGQRTLEQRAGGKDAGVRGLIQLFVQQQLSWAERELLQTQSDLRRHGADLDVRRAEDHALATTPLAPAALDEALAAEPTIQAAQDRVSKLRELVAGHSGRSARGEADPTLQAYRRQLAEAEQALAAARQRLSPAVTEKVRTLARGDVARSVRQLEVQIAAVKKNEAVLTDQVDKLRNHIQDMAKNAVQLDADREDMSHLEELTKKFVDEEGRLRIEIRESPARFSLLEEAVVLGAFEDTRRVLATAGVAAGALVLVLWGLAQWEFRGKRIGTTDEVVHGLGLHLMGTIPDSTARAYGRTAGDATDGILTEAVYATRTMLLRVARTESLRVVMITSAHSGEGKTTLSTHLVASLAQAGYRTLLIDGDLRNPTAHRVFDLESAPGFCELLRGEIGAAEAMRATPVDGLSMIPAGRWDGRASQALAGEGHLNRILRPLRDEFDFVVVDSSPVLPVSDPLLIGQQADGVILSVLRDVSRMPSVYAAHQRLTASGARVLGAVVSGVRGQIYGEAYAYK